MLQTWPALCLFVSRCQQVCDLLHQDPGHELQTGFAAGTLVNAWPLQGMVCCKLCILVSNFQLCSQSIDFEGVPSCKFFAAEPKPGESVSTERAPRADCSQASATPPRHVGYKIAQPSSFGRAAARKTVSLAGGSGLVGSSLHQTQKRRASRLAIHPGAS